MKLQNKAMLITYPDSLGHNLKDLSQVMDRYFSKAIGGIHLLPFFPSHGDRGFSPMTYEKVAPEFGSWSDVEKLGEQYYLMFDFMINHISAHSDYYLDLQKNKEKSPWRDLFLSWDKFWPAGRPTQADVDLIYKRKDKAPWEELEFADGSREKMWNTFGPDQIDLDVRTEVLLRPPDDRAGHGGLRQPGQHHQGCRHAAPPHLPRRCRRASGKGHGGVQS